MVKVTSPNQQGQIVIPIEFRKMFNITKETYLEVYVQDGQICIKPLEQKINRKDDCFVDFPKETSLKPYHFHSKNPEEDNLAGKIDEILYS